MSNQKETTEATKPDAAIDTSRLLEAGRFRGQKVFVKEEFLDREANFFKVSFAEDIAHGYIDTLEEVKGTIQMMHSGDLEGIDCIVLTLETMTYREFNNLPEFQGF